MSRAENIGSLSEDKGFVSEEMRKDKITLAEHLLNMGNTEAAKECYISAGMPPKQAGEIIKDWLSKHKETIH